MLLKSALSLAGLFYPAFSTILIDKLLQQVDS